MYLFVEVEYKQIRKRTNDHENETEKKGVVLCACTFLIDVYIIQYFMIPPHLLYNVVYISNR